jgi:phosphocarrier protein HPr
VKSLEEMLTLRNQKGLHARAAALFVQTASRFKAKITVHHRSEAANGKSIMNLMILAAPCGSALKVQAEGEDAVEALAALKELIHGRFGEDR